MFIKLVIIFLLASIVSFLILPLEVISFSNEDVIISAGMGIDHRYEWFGAIRQADDVANNPLAYLTNSYNYDPYIHLAVKSLLAGLLLSFVWYFFRYKKSS